MTNFTGYPAQVWNTSYQSLLFLSATISDSASSADTVSAAESVLATLIDGVEAIDANDLLAAWQSEAALLAQIESLPLTISPQDGLVFETRAQTYASAAAALANIVPQPPFSDTSVLSQGQPMIPSAGLLDFFMTFAFEPAPAGLTPQNIQTNAQAVATSLLNVANAVLAFQGQNLTQLYDVALREANVAQASADALNNLTAGPLAVADTTTWNTMVALPAMLRCADIINSAPATFASQQSGVIRYRLITSAEQISFYLLTLRGSPTQQVSVATLFVNESLMDFAARTLGNFELWTEVATLNNLQPPYVGPIRQPNIAAWGSTLVLPTPGTAVSAAGSSPSYTINFLGTDLYIGPINGSMPPWTGDYQLITGYSNLAWALGRRVQTTINSLIYHPPYGSRIPPEVGAVQDNRTAGNIAAFGQSAILSDPRVQTVPSATATLVQQGVEFSGIVQPKGFSSPSINVNEVIGPQ